MTVGFSQEARRKVNAFWANELGVLPGAFDADGATVITRPAADGTDYAHFFRYGRCVVIACSPAVAPAVTVLAAGRAPETIFDAAVVERHLGRHVARLVGPTYLGYLDALDGSNAEATCLLDGTDGGLLSGLRATLTATEWEHGGLDEGQPLAGVVVDGRLVSAAGYEVWGDAIAHVCVVTAPRARGLGYGRSCVAAITREAVSRGLVAQYQTLYSNAASMAIGRAVGYVDFASRIYVAATAT